VDQQEYKETLIPPPVSHWLAAKRHNVDYRRQAIHLLLELIRIDSTPKSDPAEAAKDEKDVFDIIAEYLTARHLEVQLERLPIRLDIGEHPYFTMPYYAASGAEKTGRDGRISAETKRIYENRHNLLARLPKPNRHVLAFNAHIDTVSPHITGNSEADRVFGRGALDDKGSCLAMMLALDLLAQISAKWDIRPACELLFEFVTDEETGGNGSLSLALDKQKSRCDAIVVLEPTQLRLCPANRGVVWYATRLEAQDALGCNESNEVTIDSNIPAGSASEGLAFSHPEPSLARRAGKNVSGSGSGRDVLLEAMAFVVGALGDCGDAIKAESDHPMFPHRPVQTCHGMLAQYGQHPSRVNDHIPLRLSWQGPLEAEVKAQVDVGLAEYCRRYGDKTKPGASENVLERHLAYSNISDTGVDLKIFGLAGHMGSVDRLDGAITKAAAIIRQLVKTRLQRGKDWQSLTMTLIDRRDFAHLVIEGGQGFLPTHTMEDVSERMCHAVRAGVGEYTKLMGLPQDAISCETTFDKLHNASFVGPVDGPALSALRSIGRQLDIDHGEPLRGFDASCDARIFAREFPEAEVITFGPGDLAYAHANDEQIDIKDILLAAETLVRLALTYRRESKK